MSKRILIFDSGLNVELALSFAKAGYDTGYVCAVGHQFPRGQYEEIGGGFEEFQKFDLLDLDEALDWAEVVVCPDTFSKWMVNMCKRLEIPVFGAGEAEMMEHDRSFLKHYLERVGLPVVPYAEIKGMEALEAYLRKATDERFVKLDSKFRGTKETFKHKSWMDTSRDEWPDLMKGLGANSELAEFIVEKKVESKFEVGRDELVCNGALSSLGLTGLESKDKGYLGFVCKNPPPLAAIDAKLQPYLRETGAKMFISNEVRYDKNGVGYVTDMTHRTGHPVIEGQLVVFDNIPDAVVTMACQEKIPVLQPVKPYVAIVVVRSEALAEDWVKVGFPKEKRDFVKFQNAHCRKGAIWITPKTFAACLTVGIGDTPKKAVGDAVALAGEIEVDGKHYDADALDRLLEESVPAGIKLGIPFS